MPVVALRGFRERGAFWFLEVFPKGSAFPGALETLGMLGNPQIVDKPGGPDQARFL